MLIKFLRQVKARYWDETPQPSEDLFGNGQMWPMQSVQPPLRRATRWAVKSISDNPKVFVGQLAALIAAIAALIQSLR